MPVLEAFEGSRFWGCCKLSTRGLIVFGFGSQGLGVGFEGEHQVSDWGFKLGLLRLRVWSLRF